MPELEANLDFGQIGSCRSETEEGALLQMGTVASSTWLCGWTTKASQPVNRKHHDWRFNAAQTQCCTIVAFRKQRPIGEEGFGEGSRPNLWSLANE
jgi:hypothetical protein